MDPPFELWKSSDGEEPEKLDTIELPGRRKGAVRAVGPEDVLGEEGKRRGTCDSKAVYKQPHLSTDIKNSLEVAAYCFPRRCGHAKRGRGEL